MRVLVSGLADGLLRESFVDLTQFTHPAQSTMIAADVRGYEARLRTCLLSFT